MYSSSHPESRKEPGRIKCSVDSAADFPLCHIAFTGWQSAGTNKYSQRQSNQ